MKRILCALALLLMPAGAFASNEAVNVNVRIGGGNGWLGDDAWIEMRPDCGAFVALYGTFSDGNVELLFPTSEEEDQWIGEDECRVVHVSLPCGVALDHVQAVASARWFDPTESWVADDGYGWAEPRVVVAAAFSVRSSGYQVSYCAPRHNWSVVRRWAWNDTCAQPPRQSTSRWRDGSWNGGGERWRDDSWNRGRERWRDDSSSRGRNGRWNRRDEAGRDGAAERRSVRWNAGERWRGRPESDSGEKSSRSYGNSGEPERRSRR